MRKKISAFLAIGSALLCNSVSANYLCDPCMQFPQYPQYPQQAEYLQSEMIAPVCPLINYVRFTPIYANARLKQATVREQADIGGFKFNIDILNPCSIYAGSEIGFKFACPRGRARNFPLVVRQEEDPDCGCLIDIIELRTVRVKSDYFNVWAELRLGYTLGFSSLLKSIVAPYFVIGYEGENHEFESPSPLKLKNKLDYGYFGVGAVSVFSLTECLAIGLNLNFKWIFTGILKARRVQNMRNRWRSISNNFNWYIEIPVIYNFTQNVSIGVAPFIDSKKYEKNKMRSFGTEDARLRAWGANIQIGYAF